MLPLAPKPLFTVRNCSLFRNNASHADGEETRALINALNVQSLQAQLNDSKNQISDLNQTNTLIANNASQTQTILQHLIPFFMPVATNSNNGNSGNTTAAK